MLFPELLYVLSPRDENVTWLDPIIFRLSALQAIQQLDAVGDVVPEGKALLLHNASVQGVAAGGQTVVWMDLNIERPPATILYPLANKISTVQFDGLNLGTGLLIPPGWRIRGRINFNSGLAANQVILTYFGVLIPIANIQRV